MFWPGHCGIMLGASAVLLFICVCVVRRVALHQAIGQSGVLRPKRRKGRKSGGGLAEQQVLMASPRRVAGPPVLWKEFRTPMLGRRKILMSLAVALALIVLLITYAMCVDDSIMDDVETHIAYVVIFIALGILFTIVFPATCITSEKESRSWPLLLATTQSDWQILFGKFAGILRRCLPIWLLLFGHLVVFSLVQHIHPLAIFQMGVLVAGIVAFLSGSGLYFSARFKHSTTAVIMNFTIAAVIWALLPILIGIAAGISGSEAAIAFIASYMDTNPFVQAGVVVDGAMESLNSYYWPGLESLSAAQSSIWILACMAGYMTLGLLFAWRAKCLFRRDVF